MNPKKARAANAQIAIDCQRLRRISHITGLDSKYVWRLIGAGRVESRGRVLVPAARLSCQVRRTNKLARPREAHASKWLTPSPAQYPVFPHALAAEKA